MTGLPGGFLGPISWQEAAVPHQFFAQFPTQIIRETILKNREFLGKNRESIDQISPNV
jgi:hypothetical protein